MNFLAHCALADDAASVWGVDAEARRGLLAGAFIGDFIKGPLPADWPAALQAGARLHRRVDALSNRSAGIRRSCDRFPDHLRRFAPIFVDMLADHSLAHTWEHHYPQSITAFSAECYTAIAEHAEQLPARGQRFFDYMQDVDLLANYHDWDHVARGLHSVLRRLNREPWFAEVEAASRALIAPSREDFAGYYPELRRAWEAWDAFEAIAAPRNS